jgi:hypothetical protein
MEYTGVVCPEIGTLLLVNARNLSSRGCLTPKPDFGSNRVSTIERRSAMRILVSICLFFIASAGHAQLSDEPHISKEWDQKLASDIARLADDRTRAKALTSDSDIRMTNDGRLIVTIVPLNGQAATVVSKIGIANAGAEILAESSRLLRVAIRPEDLNSLAQVDGVGLVRQPIRPFPQITTEGLSLIDAVPRHQNGVTGQGVKVAIIDGGFEEANVLGADMPPTWQYLDYTGEGIYEGGSHGTACAEVIHDIAPDAELYFLRVDDLIDLELAASLVVRDGIDIVNHSMSWVGTGFGDGRGWACEIANDATDGGALWVNAAGNYAQKQFSGLYRDSDSDDWHEFDSDGVELLYMDVEAGDEINIWLTWNDWPSSYSDYDLYLYYESPTGDLERIAWSLDVQAGTEPAEHILHTATISGSYGLTVRRLPGASTEVLKVWSQSHDFTNSSSLIGNIGSPADATGALAVGAVYHGQYRAGPIETYSSRGPTVDGRIKPDLVAPTGVATRSYAGGFFGTSAAAPHVAGAAALLLSESPGMSVSALRTALLDATEDLGESGQDNTYGFGKLVLPGVLSLDTSPRVTGGGTWDYGNSTIRAGDNDWHFTAFRATGNGITVDGVYDLSVTNNTSSQLEVSYHFRFFDSGDSEVTRFTGLDPFVLSPGESRRLIGTFTIELSGLSAAERIGRMAILASFDEQLRTDLRELANTGSGWDFGSGRVTIGRSWQYLSDEPQGDSVSISGTYEVDWSNGSDTDAYITYSLIFRDDSGVEVGSAWVDGEAIVLAGGTTQTSGTFVFSASDIESANSTSYMSLSATLNEFVVPDVSVAAYFAGGDTVLSGVGPNEDVNVLIRYDGYPSSSGFFAMFHLPHSGFQQRVSGVFPGEPIVFDPMVWTSASAVSDNQLFSGATREEQVPSAGYFAITQGPAYLLSAGDVELDGVPITYRFTTSPSFTPDDEAIIELHLTKLYLRNLPNHVMTQPIRLTVNPAWARRALLSLSQSELEFGELQVGTQSSVYLWAKSTGTADVVVSAINVSNTAFTISQELPIRIPPGDSVRVEVTFLPGSPGEHLAEIDFVSNDSEHATRSMTTAAIAYEVDPSPVAMDLDAREGDQEQRSTGDAVPGTVVEVQLIATAFPEVEGWRVDVAYDESQIVYEVGSFEPSDFVPGLVGLVNDKPGRVSIGGAVLDGSSRSGDGTLGTLRFEVIEGFKGEAFLVIDIVSLKPPDRSEKILRVLSSATVTSEHIERRMPADFNGDGVVDFSDFFVFANAFGSSNEVVDLTGDGVVDFSDFFVFVNAFGSTGRAKLLEMAVSQLGLPDEPLLRALYPNPFNASVTIPFAVPQQGVLQIAVYDMAGQLVRLLATGPMPAGLHRVQWDGRDTGGRQVATGVYLVSLAHQTGTRTRKVMLLR